MLAFEHDNDNDNDWRISNIRYYSPNVEIEDYNVMIDRKNVIDQTVKNDKVTYENIRNITIGQGDDYATGCLLAMTYLFQKILLNDCKDLSKKQVLDADPKAIQQTNFTTNLDRAGNTRFYQYKNNTVQ